jgi:hypothetical protein
VTEREIDFKTCLHDELNSGLKEELHYDRLSSGIKWCVKEKRSWNWNNVLDIEICGMKF